MLFLKTKAFKMKKLERNVAWIYIIYILKPEYIQVLSLVWLEISKIGISLHASWLGHILQCQQCC